MSITFVASSEFSMPSADTAIPIPTPSGTTLNDFMYLVIAVNQNSTTIAPPTGWNIWAQGPGTAVSYGVFYRFATGSEPTNQSFTVPSGRYQAMLTSYRGVDTTSPLIGTPSTATATSTLVAAPSINPAVIGAMVLAVRVFQHATGIDTTTQIFSSTNMTVGNHIASTTGSANQSAGNAYQIWNSGAFVSNLTQNLAFTQNRVVVGALNPAPSFRGWGIPAKT